VAEVILENPPFIGASAVRAALGDGYAEALRSVWPQVPESADFVMHWWQRAAHTVRTGGAHRFGLITTNSLRQTFNRRVIEAEQNGQPALHLAFAIPDHPWVDNAQGAAVRIAMSVGTAAASPGRLLTVTEEHALGDGEVEVGLLPCEGAIHADLRIGADVASARPLRANAGLSSPGVKLHGAGFIVTRQEATSLGLGQVPGIERHIREYRNGRDLAATSRDVMVIDLYGLEVAEVRDRFPGVYQWVHERVKPERDAKSQSKDGAGYAKLWWVHGKPRTELRPALAALPRFIATIETAKHRTFQFLDASVLPDNMLIAVALPDALWLGLLSSSVHVAWALATGGTLEDRPRYNKSRCFETFPFPNDDTGLTPDLTTRIRTLAEQLDSHRKTQQAAHPELTLTGMYNVLEKLRTGEALNPKDKLIHTQGLVSVLKSLHDDLDAAVLAAYGWQDLQAPLANHTQPEARAAAVETLLERLVALNAKRAAEEAAGQVRWLRPDFQQRGAGVQAGMDMSAEAEAAADSSEPAETTAPAAPAAPKRPWPSGLPEQIKAVAELLATHPGALALPDIEARFTARGRWRERLPTILDTLESVGRARRAGPAGLHWQGA